MTSKCNLSLCLLTLLLALLTLLSCVNASPVEFLEHLKGCHKGDKVKGINNLKKYLGKYGYLNYKNRSNLNNDDFDDLVEKAIKTYQINYHLKATGTLDDKTVSTMMNPRCGMPDIINGTSSMRSGYQRHQSHHDGSIHSTAHYSFFGGNPKWPSSKYSLTYGFAPNTRSDGQVAVERALATWQGNTHFRFFKASTYEAADLKISFHKGDHGDGASFDGPGGVIAHAFAPTNGVFHYDADEPWTLGVKQGAYDLETVALHEIGHLLGLGHSSVKGAIMEPSIASGLTKGLHGDDIQGIKALYRV